MFCMKLISAICLNYLKNGKYLGDPKNSTCFYELHTDFVFTFSLNDEEDRNITTINFVNRPNKDDVDVVFRLECFQAEAKVNLTLYSGMFNTVVSYLDTVLID